MTDPRFHPGKGKKCEAKRRFDTKRDADAYLLEIMMARAFAPDDDPVRDHAPMVRSYKCWTCDGFHLTSHAKTGRDRPAAGASSRPAT